MSAYDRVLVVQPELAMTTTEATVSGRIVVRNLTTGADTVVAAGTDPPPPPPPPPAGGNPMGIIAQWAAMTGDVSSLMVAGDTALWTVATTDGSSRGESSSVPQVLTGPNMSVTYYSKTELDVGCVIRTSGGSVKQTLGPQRIPIPSERLIDLTTFGMHGETVVAWTECTPRTQVTGMGVALVQTHGATLTPTHYRQWTGSTPAADAGWVTAGSWPGVLTTAGAGEKWNVQAKFVGPASASTSVVRTYKWRYTLPTTGVVQESRPFGVVFRSQAAFAARYPAVGTFRPLPACRPDSYPSWRVDNAATTAELAAAGDWTDGSLVSVASPAMVAKLRADMDASWPYGGFYLNTPTAYTFSVNFTDPTDPPVDVQYAGFRAQPGWRGDNGVGIPIDVDSAISSPGTDGHGIFYDSSTDLLFDAWKMQVRHDDAGVVRVFSETGGREANHTTQGDFIFDSGSVSASGLTVISSNVSLAEVAEVQRRAVWNAANPGGPYWSMRGAIPHVVSFAAPLGSVTWRRRSWPAKSNDGWGNANTADMLMEGQRIRLDPNENPDTYSTAGAFARAVAWAARDHGMVCVDMAGAFVVTIEDTRGYTSAWGQDAWAMVTNGIGSMSLSTGVPWTTKLQFLKRSWGQNGAPIGRTGTNPAGWVQGGPSSGGGGNTATARFGIWHHGWSGPALRNYPAQVKANLTNVCLGMGQGSGTGDFNYQPYNDTIALHAADIRAFVAAGKNVSVGVGGSGGGVKVLTQTHANQFVAAVQRCVNTYGINGVNLDIESNEWDQVPLANACMQLRALYGPTFQIEVTTSMYEPLQTKWMNFLNYLGHENYSWTGPMLYDFVESTDSRLTAVSLSKCAAMAAAGVPQNKMTLGYMLQPYPGYNASPNVGVITTAYAACKAAYPSIGGMWFWEDFIDQGRSWEWSLGAKSAV